MEYHQAASKETHGNYGHHGFAIHTTFKDIPQEVNYELHTLIDQIEDILMTKYLKQDAEAIARAQVERQQMLGLFGTEAIFVEELPNGYCSRWCCKHLPWFRVTTRRGIITVGWRKRVINIKWEGGQLARLNGEAIFAAEEVTKSKDNIHAWCVEDAQRYVNTLLNS